MIFRNMGDRIKVFISYAWESDKDYQAWVLKLADDLGQKYGCFALLDQYDVRAGKGLTTFMERAIIEADKVLILLTPTYKTKAMTQQGGVGYEHSIVTTELYDLQGNNDKFIPILRKGDKGSSAPGYIKSLTYEKMLDDDLYETDLRRIAGVIYGIDGAVRPPLGPIPNFNNLPNLDPILEAGLKKRAKKDAESKRIDFLNTGEAVDISLQEIDKLFESIKSKAEVYTEATGFIFNVNHNSEELGLRGEGGCGIYMRFSYRVRNSTNDNILLIKLYERFPFEWTGNRLTSYEREGLNPSRTEYVFDVDLDLKTYGWRQVDTETTMASEKLEAVLFKWILDQISAYVDKDISKRRNW